MTDTTTTQTTKPAIETTNYLVRVPFGCNLATIAEAIRKEGNFKPEELKLKFWKEGDATLLVAATKPAIEKLRTAHGVKGVSEQPEACLLPDLAGESI